ncbi:MAG: type II toxin-antitoxin system PrlF family antitoxin, partial [Rhodoluna sp.]
LMNPNEEESSLTDRYQTTVPARIRKLLGLTKRDKLQWIIDDSGTIILRKAQLEESDPIFDSWLDFIEKDIFEHPERLVPLDDKWYEQMVAQFSSEIGKGVPGLPATLEEFLKQPHVKDIADEF